MRLAILVLANTCNIRQLILSRRWNSASPFPVFYRSYCGDCAARFEVECLPCCRAGGFKTNWHGKSGMITRLGNAFKSLDLHNFTHVLKIDDDTRINYQRLVTWLTAEGKRLSSPLNVFGQCEYAKWEKMTFCSGGAGVLSHTALLREALENWPAKGPDDVEMNRIQVKLGARLVHNREFRHECDQPFESSITLHHCRP